MARYAIVENGTIINVIAADEDFIADNFPNAILCPNQYGVGDSYVNKKFVSKAGPTKIDESETL